MITIRATSFQGQPPPESLACEFDETGGTIGRAINNQLVLPDPQRHVSRVHAKVVFRDGQFLLIDQGSANPVQINGRVLGNGLQALLADGDELRIGEYVLEVARRADVSLSEGTQINLSLALRVPAAPAAGEPLDIPLALFGSGSPAAGAIAEDFDSFAGQNDARSLNVPTARESKPPNDLDLNLRPQASGRRSIDSLFGLKSGDAPASDPFAPGNAAPTQASNARPSAVAAPEVRAAAGFASEEELLRAFLSGLGEVPGLQLDRLTPEMMGLIGELLRETVQGMLDLLLARTMTKREVHAEVTMIAGRENNPLKFSPNAMAALLHLLGPPVRGFMTPQAALKDAYDDLRAHTFGFMAGLRAALAGVLARFNPENLEKRLSEKSMLDSLLPMNRRAKLWDLFSELYHDISQEAEADFHNLFGREFLRAYEEQVDRLAKQDNIRTTTRS